MARFSNRSIPRRAVSQRQTLWTVGVSAAAYVTIAASSKTLFGSITNAVLAPFLPTTLVRIRGVVTVKSDQIAASENLIGAFGIAVVNATAQALGVTALPGPIGDPLYPWIVHQYFMHSFEFGSGIGFQSPADTQYIIDSKSMRKLRDDQALIMMFEVNSAVGGDALFQGRMLFKAG